MIGRHGINPGLNICQIAAEQSPHIGKQPATIRYGRISMRQRSPTLAVLPSYFLRKPPHGQAMPQIPGDAWQLRGAVNGPSSKAGERMAHELLRQGQTNYPHEYNRCRDRRPVQTCVERVDEAAEGLYGSSSEPFGRTVNGRGSTARSTGRSCGWSDRGRFAKPPRDGRRGGLAHKPQAIQHVR
jgi:hypothetical protein